MTPQALAQQSGKPFPAWDNFYRSQPTIALSAFVLPSILDPTRFTSHRRKPYTEAGIKRMKCVRCGQQAYATWEICADGNYKRPLCQACDVALNRLVLEWVGHPDIEALMKRYEGANG